MLNVIPFVVRYEIKSQKRVETGNESGKTNMAHPFMVDISGADPPKFLPIRGVRGHAPLGNFEI